MNPKSEQRPLSDTLAYIKFAGAKGEKPMSYVLNALDRNVTWKFDEVQVADPALARTMGETVFHAQREQAEPAEPSEIVVFGDGGVGLIWTAAIYPGYEGVREALKRLMTIIHEAFAGRPVQQTIWRYRDVYDAHLVEDDENCLVQWPLDPVYQTAMDSWSTSFVIKDEQSEFIPRLRLSAQRIETTQGHTLYVLFTEASLTCKRENTGEDPSGEGPLGMFDTLHLWSKYAFWKCLTDLGRERLGTLFTEAENSLFVSEPGDEK